ncbi:uncharacterized protein EV154DRAFT_488663 [Mucor mucedo]|uniref:uncharacterized protein n=1 Tax=Mucor mucedo TaxID=29922 RepID=UPI00221EC7F6|nr:uncharacterized protein EV154DRAFT_488663 [Mucor mucedo]KAI7865823.1 hypothetical protein EV154DRAFT_488663 [Mucor mucedo]
MITNQDLYSSAEPLIFQRADYQNIDQLAAFASSMIYVMWHCRKSTNLTCPGGYLTSFSYGGKSTSSFRWFCSYVFKAMAISESAVYLSLKYVALLLRLNPAMEGSEGSEYRVFVVALILACKFLDDVTFVNTTWSEVSGMTLTSLNQMEAEFLQGINYRLFIKSQDYNQWKTLADECRDRLSCYGLPTTTSEQEKTVLSVLYTIGLRPLQPLVPVATKPVAPPQPTPAGAAGYSNHSRDICYNEIDAAIIKQYQNSYIVYRHFMQSASNHVNSRDHPIQQQHLEDYTGCHITNLSGSTWDPLYYSIYGSNNNNYKQPIPWPNA